MAQAGQESDNDVWCPHEPTQKQSEFVFSTAREHGYGGAAGGGKSDAALMRVASRVTDKQYSALIVRRSLAELTKSDGLIPRSHEWWGKTSAKWHGQEKLWTFPSGARVEFGYCEGPYDHLRYQGAAYIDILFEELTQWADLTAYLYLYSRQRRLQGCPLEIFTGATFNPGGPGHEAVKDRFLTNMPEGTLFTSAKLEDNPHLDQEAYDISLSYLDPITRAQLRHGDWEASPIGRYVKRDWFKFVNEAPPLTRWVRGWDTGASENGDHTAGVKLGVHGRDVIIADVRRGKWDTPTVTQMVKETANDDGGDVAVGIEQAHFALAVIQDLSRDKEFARFPLIKIPIAGRDKEQRSRGWRARLGNGEVYLVRGPWNEAYIEECLRFTNQKTDTDDQIDATSVAFEAVFKTMGGLREEPRPAPPNSFAALGLQNHHETD